MTQSKNSDETITLNLDDIIDMNDSYTITLDNTEYGNSDLTFDTSYDGTFTIDSNTINTVSVNTDWLYNNMIIDPDEVEKMCKEYPSLEKVWRNFKSVYDMVKKDYEGKKKAGEIDDDIPF